RHRCISTSISYSPCSLPPLLSPLLPYTPLFRSSAILLLRRHMGMIVPAPVQAATIAALGDATHVQAQREIYQNRRQRLLSALTRDRKSTRLNSSHVSISYAVFCLKKKKKYHLTP